LHGVNRGKSPLSSGCVARFGRRDEAVISYPECRPGTGE